MFELSPVTVTDAQTGDVPDPTLTEPTELPYELEYATKAAAALSPLLNPAQVLENGPDVSGVLSASARAAPSALEV